MTQWTRIALALAAPLLLVSCFFPGKFTSTLDVRSDRSFTFTYVGEVYLADDDQDSGAQSGGDAKPTADQADKAAKREAQRKAAVDALSKEAGYRSVRYLGDGKLAVDYAIGGKLDRSFLFPFNSDAEALFPWVVVEVRRDGTARMQAPAFGEDSSIPNIAGQGSASPNDKRDGTFTLTTDAEIVMHNVEAGAIPGAVKTLAWRVTPTSKTVPTAVLRFAN